jgi:hypothetical protein
MAIVRAETEVAAAPEICFDLARSVDAHLASAAATGERAIAGVTTGLLVLGDEVTWRAALWRRAGPDQSHHGLRSARASS